jgi:hypothetical protein
MKGRREGDDKDDDGVDKVSWRTMEFILAARMRVRVRVRVIARAAKLAGRSMSFE